MDIVKLRETLFAAIENGQVVLDATTIDDTNVLALASAVTGQPSLTLEAPTLGPLTQDQSANETFFIEGKVTILGLKSTPVQGSITAIGTGFRLVLQTTALPPDWSLTTLFPVLAVPAEAGSRALQPFAALETSDPVLVLASADFVHPSYGALFGGLSFVANVQLPKVVGLVLRGEAPSHVVVGFLEIDPASFTAGPLHPANIDLVVPFPSEVQFPSPFDRIQLSSTGVQFGAMTYTNGQGPPLTTQWASIDGALACGNVKVDVTILLPSTLDSSFEIRAMIDGANASIALGDIAHLLGWKDFATSLPPAVQAMTDLSLTSLGIGFDPTSPAITFFSAVISSNASWSVPLPRLVERDASSVEFWGLEMAIRIDNPITPGDYATSVLVTGRGRFCDAEIQAMASFPRFDVEVFLVQGWIDLAAIVDDVFPQPGLRELLISTLDLTVAETPKGNSASFLLGSSEDWNVGPLQISNLALGITHDPTIASTTGMIAGTVTFANATVAIQSALPDLRLEAMFPEIRLADVVDGLVGSQVELPSLLDLTFPAAKMVVSWTPNTRGFSFSVSGQSSALGAFAFDLADRGGASGYAIGFSSNATIKPSSIHPRLAVLDVFELDNPTLVFADFEDPSFSFGGSLPASALPIGVTHGINLYANLSLTAKAGCLGLVHTLFGTSSIAVAISTGGNASIEAQTTSNITFPGTSNFAFRNAGLRIYAYELETCVYGTLVIPIGSQSLTLEGRLDFVPPPTSSASFCMQPNPGKRWMSAPMGFSGVRLEAIGVALTLGFEPPSLDLALSGKFSLGDNEGADDFAFAFGVVGGEISPTLLSCRFAQLGFSDIFGACMNAGVTLPAVLNEVSLSNVYVYWCDLPQTLPDGSLAVPGFGFNGSLSFFGWNATASVQAYFDSGVKGTASMAPIHLGDGALSITGAGGQGGLSVSVDTSSSPYLMLSLDVTLFGVVGSNVAASITDTALTFTFENTAGILDRSLVLSVVPDPDNAAFEATSVFTSSVNCQIDVHVTPRVPETGLSLGTLHVEAGFVGQVTVYMSTSSFSAQTEGRFDWNGNKFTLPSFRIHTPWANMGNLVEPIEAEIRKKAQIIFGPLLTDAKAYFRAVANGFVTREQNLLRLAKDVFSLNYVDALTMLTTLGIQVAEDPYNVVWFRNAVPSLIAANWTASQLSGAAGCIGVSLHAFMDLSIGNVTDPTSLAKDAYAVFSGHSDFATVVTQSLASLVPGPGAATTVATMMRTAGIPETLVASAFETVFPGAKSVVDDVWGGVKDVGNTIEHTVTTVIHDIFSGW